MNKKIILLIILCLFAISCGKKGNPVYKNSQDKSHLQITITNNASANRVTDIFIRVGIPNNTNALTSGDAYYSNKKIANISVKLNA